MAEWRNKVATTTIDAALVQKMFLAGAKNLESKKEWINDLNVFPVPDGDTGTNMTLTIMSAAKEVSAIANPTMENLAKAISTGSLRGARGNSGVILSQLLRGFTKEMSQVKEITVKTLAVATGRATETAYKAVMKPKEGTILTVAKGVSDKAAEIADTVTDIEEALSVIIDYAEDFSLNLEQYQIIFLFRLLIRQMWVHLMRLHPHYDIKILLLPSSEGLQLQDLTQNQYF